MNERHSRFPDDERSDDAISALADGVLQGEEFAAAMQHLSGTPEARRTWHAYHVVGDALRSDALAGGAGDMAFLARLEARLALEPGPAAAAEPPSASPARVAAAMPAPRPAANGDVFRWKMVAGFASIAAVAAIGWQTLQFRAPSDTAAVLAQSPASGAAAAASGEVRAVRAEATQVASSPAPDSVAEAAPVVMLRNPQLDELLAAHSRAVGGAVLQGQARLLRNVSVGEESAR